MVMGDIDTMIHADLGINSSFMVYLSLDATFALPTLERQLAEYVNNPLNNDQPFDLTSVPVISKAQEEEEQRRK